jgi:signal peptidase I
MTKDKHVADPAVKRRQYFWGGLGLAAVGLVATVLNLALPVPEYQKISNFSVFFFVAGGCLGIILGAPDPARIANPALRRLAEKLWLIVTVVVVAVFAALFFYIRRADGYTPTSLALHVGLLLAYFYFLARAKLLPAAGEARAKAAESAEVLIVAIVLAVFIKGVGVQAFKIPSGSMLNTLQIGDQLLITKFLYGVPLPYTDQRLPGFRKPGRGDIVVFAYPGMDNPDRPSWLPPYPLKDPLKEQDFIKRIVGLPGETIEVRGKQVYIDGLPLNDPWAQYLYHDGTPKPDPLSFQMGDAQADMPPVRIPEGYYFAMGDNRDHSNDSRAWGFVREGRIKGKAFVIYFSWPKLGRIGTIIH